MAKQQAVRFDRIVDAVFAQQDSPENLMIRGGCIDISALENAADLINTFFEELAPLFADEAYIIWETIDAIEMISQTGAPPAGDDFQRARIFSDKGDLSVRRDGQRLYWHFIGENNDAVAAMTPAETYPDVHELRCESRSGAMLWGERIVPEGGNLDDAFWRDNRVGRVDLHYPVQPADVHAQKQRARLLYDIYWQHGQPAFYRLKKIITVDAPQSSTTH